MTLSEVQAEVAAHMDDIVSLFKPGVKITVMVRTPGFGERDFMLTDDTIAELRAMLDRREQSGG